MIYPQRMELTGEESLMDILQMVPELLIAGYEDVISSYSLRIDNCPMNGDEMCYKYRYTVKPFLIVPIIGAMFADLINTGMITLFLNIL